MAVATRKGAEVSQNGYPVFAFTDPPGSERSGQSYKSVA
jgi:hypothetical protein